MRESAEAAAELGIPFLTVYAFSTENWNRPKMEVNALMQLLLKTIENEVVTLNKNNIRLNAIGDLASLPTANQKKLQKVMDDTSNNSRMTLTLALSYSGRWDLVEAARTLARKVAEGECQPDEIDQNLLGSLLSTHEMPDPELLIRTSGEYRISNFLLWQIAYAELYFTPTLLPISVATTFMQPFSTISTARDDSGKPASRLKNKKIDQTEPIEDEEL